MEEYKGISINKVSIISFLIILALGIWGAVAPDAMISIVKGSTTTLLNKFGWLWLLICTAFLGLSMFFIFGPYAHIRLGKDDDRPEFSTLSWIAMLFAGGMGSGLIVWGVAEPIYHFATPPVGEGGTAEAARQAFVITNLHWGLHAWAIYGICGLTIAYFTFRKGLSPMISTPIRSVVKGKAQEPVALIADILGVIAVVFGVAGALAIGTLTVRSGLHYAFETPENSTMSYVILGALFVCYTVSALTGVEKGIKILSNINMLLVIALMSIVIIFGPTQFIMETFVDSIGNYFGSIVQKSFTMYPFENLASWTSGWTLTYLIWWLAWGPFIGIFIARISRGRTIREFMIGVVLAPTLFSMLWFATFGGAAIQIELFGGGGLQEIIFDNLYQALFAFLKHFPASHLLSAIAVILLFVFLVTSADSGTLVLAMMTSKGNLNPSAIQKWIWGVLLLILSISTLVSESFEVAKSMAIVGALPFSIVVNLQIIGLFKELRKENKPE